MKIYARQVNPENQESPLTYYGIEEFYPWVAIRGNNQLRGYVPERMEKIIKNWSYLLDDGGNFLDGYDIGVSSLTELIDEYIPKNNGEKYSTKQVATIKKWIYGYKNDNEAIAQVLTWVTGKKYDYEIITGVVQGDWQYCFYPSEEEKNIRYVEADYFNTGTEWHVWLEEEDKDIESTSFYGYEWQDEEIKKEIARAFEGKAEDVTLYIYDGYTTTPKYREV